MTKKEKKITNKEINLEEKLQEIKKEQDTKEKKEKNHQEVIANLERKLTEQEEITKKAQHNYIDLKMDFERLVRQTEEKTKTMKKESTIEIVKKLLPFVENLRKSLVVIQDKSDDPLAKGVNLVYENFLKTLGDMGITKIDAIGLEPDSMLHEPVSMQPTNDKNLKGKIIEEFERGFIYEKDGERKVITPAKVIIGQ